MKTRDEAIRALLNLAKRLSSLGHSFVETGNTTLGHRLADECEIVLDSVELLEKLEADRIKEKFFTAEQSSLNVLNAAMAGIEKGKTQNGN